MSQMDKLVFTCPKCGTEVLKEAEGCSNCGERLEWDESDSGPATPVPQDTASYAPNAKRALVAKRGLLVCIILAGLQVVFILWTVFVSNDSRGATGVYAILDIYQGMNFMGAMSFYSGAEIVVSVAFLMWIHRAFSNVDALGVRSLKYSPTSAVWRFIIPIINLYAPIKVVKELLRCSVASIKLSTPPQHKTDFAAVNFWWAAYLSACLLSMLPGVWTFVWMVGGGILPPRMTYLGGIYCAVNCLWILAASMLSQVITTIESLQQAGYDRQPSASGLEAKGA